MSRSGQYKWSAVGRSTPTSFSIVALRNHGKCSNGKNNSSLSNSTQKPCCEILVISTGKVLVPGIDNLPQMVFDQLLSFRHNVLGEARLTGLRPSPLSRESSLRRSRGCWALPQA
jgi:hypothetical protein